MRIHCKECNADLNTFGDIPAVVYPYGKSDTAITWVTTCKCGHECSLTIVGTIEETLEM